ncbi:MAG: hypothetical protein LBM87_02085 [Ruminococcus sp.]|jgi:hypothetical protein|nr:hypothetical protein [Ruminococcus sp.]
MINHNSKWVKQILDLQHEDGSWGFFHTLSNPTKAQPMTTEQALRRLRVLGLTKDDEPIKRAIAHMERLLTDEIPGLDRIEKSPNWAINRSRIIAADILRFDRTNSIALGIAKRWVLVMEQACASGTVDFDVYLSCYLNEFGIPLMINADKAKKQCGNDICNYYPAVMYAGLQTERAENAWLDYLLQYQGGMYYVYEKPLNIVPTVFASKQTSYWLAALEVIADYRLALKKLGFVVDYLMQNQLSPHVWDLGQQAKDGIYFPLSDSWRKAEDRQRDCTVRIQKLLDKLTLKVPFLTYDELVTDCDIKVRDENHERITKMFYGYSRRVSGKSGLWVEIMGKILDVDFSGATMTTGCFNSVNDGKEPPYDNPDCYIKMSDDTRVYVYGAVQNGELKQLKDNEYVLYALSDTVTDNIERRTDKHIFMR